MRLTILGCSGSVPGPDTAASGYLLEADGFVLAIEFGNGVLAQLQRRRDPFDLDSLLLTHLHPDHCADFSALTVLRRYHPSPPYDRRPRTLPVYAPADAPVRLANAFAANEMERVETDLGDVYQFHPITEQTMEIGPFTVTGFPVEHPTPAFGIRFSSGGRTLAFTGDTGPCPILREVASSADVLLAEASWTDSPDRPAGVHLSGRQAAEVAAAAEARRLLLTHITPWTDPAEILAEAREFFPGAELAEQGAEYEV